MPVVSSTIPRFVHVVNPFARGGEGMDRIQQLTLEAMAHASVQARVAVDILLAVEEKDQALSFPCGNAIPCIQRSVCDVGTFQKRKPLPLLFDILEAANRIPMEDDDYIVYTNMDIIPVPHFYDALGEIASKGIDAVSITRRTVSSVEGDTPFSALLFSEVGKAHPGTDCLVFKRRLFKRFVPFHTCLGASNVTKPISYNLAVLAERFVVMKDAYLTCHLGDDRVWHNPDFADYSAHNKKSALAVLEKLLETEKSARSKLLRFCAERRDPVLMDYFFPPSPLQRQVRRIRGTAVRWIKKSLGKNTQEPLFSP